MQAAKFWGRIKTSLSYRIEADFQASPARKSAANYVVFQLRYPLRYDSFESWL